MSLSLLFTACIFHCVVCCSNVAVDTCHDICQTRYVVHVWMNPGCAEGMLPRTALTCRQTHMCPAVASLHTNLCYVYTHMHYVNHTLSMRAIAAFYAKAGVCERCLCGGTKICDCTHVVHIVTYVLHQDLYIFRHTYVRTEAFRIMKT